MSAGHRRGDGLQPPRCCAPPLRRAALRRAIHSQEGSRPRTGALAGIGFKEVEGFSRTDTAALAPRIKEHGLTVRSCQAETPVFTANGSSIPSSGKSRFRKPSTASRAWARSTSRWVTFPPARAATTTISFRRTADRMNAAAEWAANRGCGSPGKTTLRVRRPAWPPARRHLQGTPGFETGGTRTECLLGQRRRPGSAAAPQRLEGPRAAPSAQRQGEGRTPAVLRSDRPAGPSSRPGSGDIDFPAILKAAPSRRSQVSVCRGKTRTEGDPIESLRRSFIWLNR